MSAIVATVAAGTSFLVGWVGGRIHKAEQLRSVHENEVAQSFLDGQNRGYREGWTTGRLKLSGEQLSRKLHPTGRSIADPVTQAATVIDLAARRLGKDQL